MLNVYDKSSPNDWNNIVKSFDNWDVYYLFEYAYSLSVHGDGEPLLFYYSDDECRICLVTMKSDISFCDKYEGQLEIGKYYDLETPYGYGGPLADAHEISRESQEKFYELIQDYCSNHRIVSMFVRLDPLVFKDNNMSCVIEGRYLRDTIYIDTTSEEVILKNMDPKCRNMFRKAQKNGVTIERKPLTEYFDFIPIYNETMDNNEADGYYYFGEKYYKELSKLNKNGWIYYAYMNDKPVSAAIILYNDNNMHYHLSGTLVEYRKYSPGNLLLYVAACDACREGISRFHLGGGISADDRLFGFKKQFNRSGRLPFIVGRSIFDRKLYEELLDIREELDNNFDRNNGFMIQYRR